MVNATGSAATENGSRYLQQLCKHWAHKFEVSFDVERGRIDLNGTQVDLVASPEELTVLLDAPDTATLEKMKQVVVDHLDRFAFREAPLPFVWK